MKNVFGALAVLLGLSVGAKAVEVPGNPDRFPSVGLNFGGVSESGEATVIAAPSSAKQNMDVSSGHLTLDFRLPMSSHVTLNGAIGISGTSVDAPETPLLLGQKTSTSGVTYNIGFRYYIQ